jgi:hypothetical protein
VKSIFNVSIILIATSFAGLSFSQEVGIKFGLFKYLDLPYDEASFPTVPEEAVIDENRTIVPDYSIYFQTRIYRSYGGLFQVSYSNLERTRGIKNIYSQEDRFTVIPLELLVYKEIKMFGVDIKPKIGVGYGFAEFEYFNNSTIADTTYGWKYDGSSIGLPLGFSVGYSPFKKLTIGIDFFYRHYEIDNFKTDYKCGNGKSNRMVILYDNIPAPSCIDSGGETQKDASLDFSSLSLLLVFGFGLN